MTNSVDQSRDWSGAEGKSGHDREFGLGTFAKTHDCAMVRNAIVELWFAKIERDVIARGVFTSVPDLKRKLMRYIRLYNKQPKPVKWKYFDPTRRITPDSIVTVH